MDEHQPIIKYVNIGRLKIKVGIWPCKMGTVDPVCPILFFNGIGANLETAQPIAEQFRGRGDFITFDMPGIGDSTAPRMPYSLKKMASWTRRILDVLGYDVVHVMGVSWGGAISQQFTRQYPKLVKSLVLLATSPGVVMVPGNMSALTKMWSPKRYSNKEFMLKNFETLYGDLTQEAATAHANRTKPPSGRGYTYQMMAMAGWSSLPFLKKITQPTLIVTGDEDNLIPLRNAKILHKYIPNSDLRIVKGGGHVFIIVRARQVAPIILRFFDDYAKVRRLHTNPAKIVKDRMRPSGATA